MSPHSEFSGLLRIILQSVYFQLIADIEALLLPDNPALFLSRGQAETIQASLRRMGILPFFLSLLFLYSL